MRCPRTGSAPRALGQATIDVGSDGNLVRDAVTRLSDWDRAMIYRSYYLGRTTTQIAAEFKADDDFVKQELHRALHTLRVALQERDDIARRR